MQNCKFFLEIEISSATLCAIQSHPNNDKNKGKLMASNRSGLNDEIHIPIPNDPQEINWQEPQPLIDLDFDSFPVFNHYKHSNLSNEPNEQADASAADTLLAKPKAPTKPKKNPVTDATKLSIKIIGSLLFSAATAIYSLVMLSGKSPADIGKAWWDEMSTLKKTSSILLATASELVNAELNLDFFSQLVKELQDNLKKSLHSPLEFTNNLLSIILGIGGGIAAGAIAYEAFVWLAYIVFAFAAFNLAIFFASRYLGVHKSIDRIFNRDIANLQREIVDNLNHLKSDYQNELAQVLDNKVAELLSAHETANEFGEDGLPHLTSSDYENLFSTLAKKLYDIAALHPDCLKEKTWDEYAAHYAGMLFDLTFATMMGTFAFMTFDKKCQTGIDLILRMLTNKNLSQLNKLEAIGAGGVGGVPSAFLYALMAYDFRELCTDTCKYLYENPKDIATFLVRLFANVATATGMYSVGASLPGPDNLFNISGNSYTKIISGLGNGLAAFVVNMGPTVKKYTKSIDTRHPSVAEVIHQHHNPAVRMISRDTATCLKAYTLFQPPPLFDETRVDQAVTQPNVIPILV